MIEFSDAGLAGMNCESDQPSCGTHPNSVVLASYPSLAGRESDHVNRVTQDIAVALATDAGEPGDGNGRISVDSLPSYAVSVNDSAVAELVRQGTGVLDHRGIVLLASHVEHAAKSKFSAAYRLKRDILINAVGGTETVPSRDGGANDQRESDTHLPSVVPPEPIAKSEFSAADHANSDTLASRVGSTDTVPSRDGGANDHGSDGVQWRSVVPPELIAEIREQWRRRQAWHRAEKSLTLQAKALCRRLAVDGDKKDADAIYKAALGEGSHPMGGVALAAFFPLTEARDGVEKHRKIVEKRLEKLAKQLPVAPWVKAVRGASLMSLAAVVGGAGDLSAYDNPAKLWKRMGLAVMPDNTRQRRVAGTEGIAHGYSPSRRSEIWNIGNGLIGGMGKGKRPLVGEDISLRGDWFPLEKLFVERLRYEAARDPENMARGVTKEGRESFSKHAAARAKRYVEKRFLRQLWQAWRSGGQSRCGDHTSRASAPQVEGVL